MNTSKIPQITISVSFDKKIRKSELITIQTSEEAANSFREIFNKDTFDWTEEFMILCLSAGKKVVGFYKISSGGITGTIADPRVILTVALNCCATSLILAHNHPSGNLKPSRADIEVTGKIQRAAALLDITVLDHIIITAEGHYSLLDNGDM